MHIACAAHSHIADADAAGAPALAELVQVLRMPQPRLNKVCVALLDAAATGTDQTDMKIEKRLIHICEGPVFPQHLQAAQQCTLSNSTQEGCTMGIQEVLISHKD